MSPVTRCLVRPDTYRDSVVLMRVAAELERLPGVARAALMMATPANRGLLAEAGLLDGDAVAAGPGDLVIAVTAADARVAGDALASAARLLDRAAAAPASAAGTFTAPRTIAEAAALGGANLAMISTPGAYATAEALKALKRGLSVFLFSDNVPIEDEIELKRLAVGKRLLMMGPDCGTAIVDGIPLGFANAVRRGRVGLAGASGTGLQQVSCLVDRLGEGVSQVIGVGSLSVAPRAHGAAVVPLDWRPPAGGDRELGLVLARLEDDLDDPVGARVAAANRLAVERLLAARPVLVDVRPAALVVPGLGARTILHAGPPIEWARMCGPMRGAVIGAVLYEGWAATAEAAERLARDGSIGFTPVTITARSGRWRGSSRRRCRWPSSTMRRRATAPSRR